MPLSTTPRTGPKKWIDPDRFTKQNRLSRKVSLLWSWSRVALMTLTFPSMFRTWKSEKESPCSSLPSMHGNTQKDRTVIYNPQTVVYYDTLLFYWFEYYHNLWNLTLVHNYTLLVGSSLYPGRVMQDHAHDCSCF